MIARGPLHLSASLLRRTAARFARAGGGRRGSEAIEAAFILPALILIILGLMEFGQVLWTEGALHYAVEEAARCGAIDSTLCGTAAAIQSYAVGKAAGLSLPASTFSWTQPACGSKVSASYVYNPFETYALPASITLTASACYPE